MNIDRQRVTAVQALEALGYKHQDGEWLPPAAPPLPLTAEADAMHGMLMRRADALAGGSGEDTELKSIVDLLEAYAAKRWPLGKEPGGKG